MISKNLTNSSKITTKKFIFSNLLTFWTRLAQLKNCCTERRTNYKSKHFATDHWGFHPRILK